MARIETWYKQDLKKPVPVRRLETVFNQDALGHLFGVEVYDNGQPVTLSGSINGYCLLADGTTVPVLGTRTENKAYIVLPQTAYNVLGPITITVKLTEGTAITTLLAVVGVVARSRSGQQVNPGSTITDWTNQIAEALQDVEDASAAQDAKIGDLKSAITLYSVQDSESNIKSKISITNSGINTSGAVTQNSSYLRSDYILLPKGWKINYGNLNAGASYNLISFYTAEDESTYDDTNKVVGEGASVAKSGVFTAPETGYVRICTRASEFQYVTLTIESPITDRLSDLETETDRNTDIIDGLVDIPIGEWTTGYYIDSSDGVAKSWTSTSNRIYWVSPFISVENISSISFNCVSGYAFYTSSSEGSFIENSGGGDSTLQDYTVNVPATAKYFRFTKETKMYSYTPYLRNADALNLLTGRLATTNDLVAQNQNNINKLINRLVIPVVWRENYYIGNDGAYKSFAEGNRKYWASEAIDVRNVKKLQFIGIQWYAFYDDTDTVISDEIYYTNTEPTNVSVDVPEEALYFRYTKETKKYPDYDTTLYDFTPEYKPYSNEEHYPYLVSSFRTIGVVGDSLASGECVSSDSHNLDLYDHSWLQYMARFYGFTGYNFSKGGLSTRTWLTDTKGWALAQQSGKECNAYIIGLGANDLTILGQDNSYLGSVSDIGTSADTYYGNYSRIIANLKTIRPKAKFFLLTLSYNYVDNPDRRAGSLAFNEAIKYIAEHTENCYLIDISDDPFYYSSIVTTNKRSGHYNAISYNAQGMHLAEVIGDYMFNNMDQFRKVEFIDTEYN